METFSELPIYIGLLILPYISYPDVFKCQRVNKHWHEIFSSHDLSKVALRVYGPQSFENKAVLKATRTSQGGDDDVTGLFRTFCRRDKNLRRGVSNQELRFASKRAYTGKFLWSLSGNILVYQSPAYREGLTCVVFDYEKQKYFQGTMHLGANEMLRTVRSVKLFRNIVAAEHSTENSMQTGQRGSYFLCEVQTFRINGIGEDHAPEGGVTCTNLSRFATFQFSYVDYFESIISDLSETHYAALNLRSTGSRSLGLYVWEIASGSLMYHLPIDKTQIQHPLNSQCESVVMFGDSKVMITSGDIRNGKKWKDDPEEEAAFKVHIRSISMNEGTIDDIGVRVGNPDHGVQNEIVRMKDDALLRGYGYNIHWRTIKQCKPNYKSWEDMQIYVNLWGRLNPDGEIVDHSMKDQAQTLQYALSPDNQTGGPLKCHAIYSHAALKNSLLNTMMEQSYGDQILSGIPFFMTSQCPDGMSFSMPFSGKSIEVFGTRLIGYSYVARKFRPVDDDEFDKISYRDGEEPLHRYALEFSSQLKSKDDESEVRVIPSINRNVIGRGIRGDHYYGMEIVGDERMTVYSELKEETGMASLVVNVWSPITFSPASEQ